MTTLAEMVWGNRGGAEKGYDPRQPRDAAELSFQRDRAALLAAAVKAFNPNQARAPKGATGGGRWIVGNRFSLSGVNRISNDPETFNKVFDFSRNYLEELPGEVFDREPISRTSLITGEKQPGLTSLVVDNRSGGGWDVGSGSIKIGLHSEMTSENVLLEDGSLDLSRPTSASDWQPGKQPSQVKVFLPTLLRHEAFHYAEDNLLTDSERARWGVIYRESGISKVLPEYYRTPTESLAESYAIIMHPRYKRGMLPLQVENYFADLGVKPNG